MPDYYGRAFPVPFWEPTFAMTDGVLGVYDEDCQDWLADINGMVLRYGTVAAAQAVADEQMAASDCHFVVHYIGPDGEPYVPEGGEGP